MTINRSIISQLFKNLILVLCWLFRRILGVFADPYAWLLYLLAFVVIINELFISLIYIQSWPEKTCGQLKDYTTVLLVGDPQILGENRDSLLARWDCDRFLRNWFGAVIRYSQPDIIIFLGDLIEDGHIADDEEFTRYVSRFKWIFQRDNIPTILVPGYCDYGLNTSHVERFKKFFDPLEDLERFENLEFYKARTVLESFPSINGTRANNSTVRIALNDVPVIGRNWEFSEKVVTNLRPQIIFDAYHESLHVIGDAETGEVTDIRSHDGSSKWKIEIREMVTNEIIVPTCSYRMGSDKVGYGLAMIDKKGLYSCYMILEVPQRLDQLVIYLCITILISTYLLTPYLLCYCKYIIRRSNT